VDTRLRKPLPPCIGARRLMQQRETRHSMRLQYRPTVSGGPPPRMRSGLRHLESFVSRILPQTHNVASLYRLLAENHIATMFSVSR
jgi:hypothetical protein